ncbi:MAG TPA: acyltransferase [Candidatus Didemnitutus sp.]|nr:acyltransferase [Candidatus Didemnitutus sp.]
MSSSEATLPPPSSRNVFLDHLRVCMTALVILHHCAIVYGGSGGWYWKQEPDSSNRLLILFNATNQSYFMGFFFLLAGYFTPVSFDRKGPGSYLADRGLRLGLPLLGYFFILSPMTIALARTAKGQAFWPAWLQMIQSRIFEPGPLWFAEALLIFALVYAGWRRWRGPARDWEQLPCGANMALAATITGVVAFLVRLVVPVGQNVLWLQLGYFPAYVLLFAAGCFAARARLLEKVTWEQARPWAIVSVVSFVSLLVVMATRSTRGDFHGGLNFNAAFYALWDPFISFGIILTLLWFFRVYLPTGNQFTDAVARRAYGAYILHPPVLVGLSLLAREWIAPPFLKFGVVGAAACIGSFALASVLLVLPGVRKIV